MRSIGGIFSSIFILYRFELFLKYTGLTCILAGYYFDRFGQPPLFSDVIFNFFSLFGRHKIDL